MEEKVSGFYAMHAAMARWRDAQRDLAEQKRLDEAAFMASLDWTPEQLAAYDARVQGIASRLAARPPG